MILGHGDYEHWNTAYRSRFRAEIMPAAAKQLLVSGVTFARELGGPLEDLLDVKRRIEAGEIPGPRLSPGNFHTDSTWRKRDRRRHKVAGSMVKERERPGDSRARPLR